MPSRKELELVCPIRGCSKIASSYADSPNEIEVYRPFFNEALAEHLSADHAKYDLRWCPNRLDPMSGCQCRYCVVMDLLVEIVDSAGSPKVREANA